MSFILLFFYFAINHHLLFRDENGDHGPCYLVMEVKLMTHPMFERRVLFFGGKGGVGKTTMAAATAIWAAKELEKKTLVVSTDPAHSLADSLGRTLLGDEITPINDIPGLYGIEIDAEAALNEYGSVLQAQMGENELITEFLGEDPSELSLPGSDEAVSFFKMLEFIDATDFDLIVYDTAPTGHTLKLMSLPELLDSWLYKMIKMRHRIGRTMSFFRRMVSGGTADQDLEEQAFAQLELMRDQVVRARKILTDSSQAEFIVVTIPTLMALWETERLITALRTYDMSVNQIYVNQISPQNPSCPYCSRRYENQKKALDRLLHLYRDEFEIVQVPLFDHEIQGIDSLLSLGNDLYSEE